MSSNDPTIGQQLREDSGLHAVHIRSCAHSLARHTRSASKESFNCFELSGGNFAVVVKNSESDEEASATTRVLIEGNGVAASSIRGTPHTLAEYSRSGIPEKPERPTSWRKAD